MKRFLIAALAVAFGLGAPRAFAQSTPAPAPLDRIEIFGRLAAGYSPSYIAYLVRTRGVTFSVSAGLLDQVTQLGGSGILIDSLSHAASPSSIAPSSDGDPSVDHLAKCALLIHTGDLESAEPECRASINENPQSPWPLRATLGVLQSVDFDKKAFEPPLERDDETKSGDPRTKEIIQLMQRLGALTAPPSAPAHGSVSLSTVGGVVMIGREAGIPASQMLEVEESTGVWDARNELYGFIAASSFPEEPGEPPVSSKSPEVPSQLLADVQDNPDMARFHLDLARFYSEQANDFEEALAEIREAIRLEPESERPHVQLALLYHKQKDFVNSLAELCEVTRISSAGNFEHLALAHELENAGHTADAIAEYKTVIDRHPERTDASEALVDLYVKQKDFKSAVEELRRSLKAPAASFADESKFVNRRWDDETRLAQLLKLNHDLDAAAEQYLYLLRFKPDDPDLHNSYGMLLAQQNRCADAIGEFNQSIRLSDAQNDSSYARSNVALCLSTQKDYDGAARELSSILESEPNSPIAENNVAWVYATADDPKLRNPAEALRLARLAVDSSDQPEAYMLDTLAEALLLNRKPEEASATETRAANLDPDNPELQSRLARFRDAATKSSRSNAVSAIAPQPTATPTH